MAEPEMTLPEGCKHLGDAVSGSVRASLCDIGGVAWVFGLQNTGEPDVAALLTVMNALEEVARTLKYDKLYTETTLEKSEQFAANRGYTRTSVILEKAL